MTEVMALDGVSPDVRRSDPGTSHEAADLANRPGSEAEVLRILRTYGPADDEEIYLMHIRESTVKWSPSRMRTARSALVDAGVVEATGMFHITVHARRCNVWQAVRRTA